MSWREDSERARQSAISKFAFSVGRRPELDSAWTWVSISVSHGTGWFSLGLMTPGEAEAIGRALLDYVREHDNRGDEND